METEALGSELFAYNALISGCTASRGYDRALGYLEEMVSVRIFHLSSELKYRPFGINMRANGAKLYVEHWPGKLLDARSWCGRGTFLNTVLVLSSRYIGQIFCSGVIAAFPLSYSLAPVV